MDNSNNTLQTHPFQAEVAKLLDIVINSLYTDKEIFVRELISNSADALEKMRLISLTESDLLDKDQPLEIRITADEEAGTISFHDTGCGMNTEEIEENLGTIAHSGSAEFLKALAENQKENSQLIGQFGVGFYSAFMVADQVTVESRSYRPAYSGVRWKSDGSGGYTTEPAIIGHRGTTIILKLKETHKDFCDLNKIKRIAKQYSNFVPFPIYIQGEQSNTVQAIWARRPADITEEEYSGFYKFVHFGGDEPFYRLHYNTDVPLGIHALLYFPGENFEVMGIGRMEPAVSLYCRKVLIKAKMEQLLPDYFRFIKGVVDSEDIPLNISRETMQDSALVAKIRKVLTKRLIKLLGSEAESDPEKYSKFYTKFGSFIKEGAYSDYENQFELAKLLRFESSLLAEGETTSLDGYIQRMQSEQKAIYYITGHNRASISAGPYMEHFLDKGIEVLYLYNPVDDLVMGQLREYSEKKLVSADSAQIDLPTGSKVDNPEEKSDEPASDRPAGDLARWIKEIIGSKVNEVVVSKRLVNSPALLVNPDDMMTVTLQKFLNVQNGELDTSHFNLEINPSHPILKRLAELRGVADEAERASEAALMLYDTALLSAGLNVDAQGLVERTTKLIERALR